MLCRVGSYAGGAHTAAPVGLIIDSLLTALYARPVGDVGGQGDEGSYRLPENLTSFFARGPGMGCCSPGARVPGGASVASGSSGASNSGGCDCG